MKGGKMDLRWKITKLEKQAGATDDPKWRERIAREHVRFFAANIEPMIAEVTGQVPRSEEEIFRDEMRQLEAFQSEAAYHEHMERLKPYLDDIEKEIHYRARLAGEETERARRGLSMGAQ